MRIGLVRDVKCRVCGAANHFEVPRSYGTHIYDWPSKFQYVFWPYTDPASLYSCKGCHATCFMGDFERIPTQKAEAIRREVEKAKIEGRQGPRAAVAISERFSIAERVYTVLGRGDEFWCRFYRLKGYYLDRAEKPKDAGEARKKALEIAERMLSRKENAAIRKELLLISGAMRHLLRDDVGALRDFEEASRLKYEESPATDAYLSDLLREYTARIKVGISPPISLDMA
jgi:hypothetical protein